jgi:hypothetical protein
VLENLSCVRAVLFRKCIGVLDVQLHTFVTSALECCQLHISRALRNRKERPVTANRRLDGSLEEVLSSLPQIEQKLFGRRTRRLVTAPMELCGVSA